jgi:hypothetical protein
MKFDRAILRDSQPSSILALSVCPLDLATDLSSDAKRIIEVAGMITDPAYPVVEGGRNKAIGSLLIVEAENIEEVRKTIEEDVFIQSGVVSGRHSEVDMAFNECSGTGRSSLSHLFSRRAREGNDQGTVGRVT